MTKPIWWRWLVPIVFGLALGAFFACLLARHWQHDYDQNGVTFLGSGAGLSALISYSGSRTIILGGNSAVDFSNAIAAVRPAAAPRVDLLIITPGSERVAERALAILDAAQVLIISDGARYSQFASRGSIVLAPTTVGIDEAVRFDVDPGLVQGNGIGWRIVLDSPVGQIVFTNGTLSPINPLPELIVLSANDAALPPWRAVPLAVSSTLNATQRDMPTGTIVVPAGDIRRVFWQRDR